jgi:hypothetical protein
MAWRNGSIVFRPPLMRQYFKPPVNKYTEDTSLPAEFFKISTMDSLSPVTKEVKKCTVNRNTFKER